MNDHDALLRAICENPREDTPRLAFADYLEENGQPDWAAFICSDIAMSLRDEWDADRLRWEHRVTRVAPEGLVGAPRLKDALPPLPYGLGWEQPRLFRRGFPWGITMPFSRPIYDSGVEVFARHPIAHLAFRNDAPCLRRLVAMPWFDRLTSLDIRAGRHSAGALVPLLETSVPLEELSLWYHAVSPGGLGALFGSRLFAGLRRLAVAGTGPQVGRVVLEAMHAFPSPNRLTTLELKLGVVGENVTLLYNGVPAGLVSFDLTRNRLNSERTAAFAAHPALTGLKILKLSSNPVGNAGAAALFTSPHLAGLKVLDLSYCQVGDEALRELLENSPLADGLNLLNLTGSPASADMKQAVKDRMGDRVRL